MSEQILQKQGSHIIHNSANPKHIAAIGGSAGFLYPLLKFFDCTHPNDISYVILRHIGRDVQSKLANIIRLHSGLKIVEANHNMKVERN